MAEVGFRIVSAHYPNGAVILKQTIMSQKDLYRKEASERERETLESALRAEVEKTYAPVPVVPVAKALTQKGVYQIESNRNIVRVLFISRDEALLNPAQQSLDGFLQLSDLFDEVHIAILRLGIAPKYPVLRVGKNVWLYTVGSRHWWWTPVLAKRLIEQELVFVGGMRPDLIVARDPYEAGILALRLGQHYQRPVQIHALEDYTTRTFRAAERGNWWRRFLAPWTLGRAISVRTRSAALADMLGRKFTIPDLAVLPRFHNYDQLAVMPASTYLHDRYRNFSFILLYVGRLGHESTLFRVLDAARGFLRNPRVGLVVVGEGPAQSEFQKRANVLGIAGQVVFEKAQTDLSAYLKSANALVVSDQDGDADEFVLQGAAAGVPVIMSHNPFRDEVFVDGESALLFEHASVEELSTRLTLLLNDIGLRRRLTIEAQELIRTHFHSDKQAYRLAYRDSIERALFVEEDTTISS